MQVTHDNLPQAVSGLYDKIEALEKLIKNNALVSPIQSDEIMTIEQAALLINLAVPTLYSKVHKRQIPVCKQGGRLYFSKMELVAWLKSGRKRTVSEIAEEARTHTKIKI